MEESDNKNSKINLCVVCKKNPIKYDTFCDECFKKAQDNFLKQYNQKKLPSEMNSKIKTMGIAMNQFMEAFKKNYTQWDKNINQAFNDNNTTKQNPTKPIGDFNLEVQSILMQMPNHKIEIKPKLKQSISKKRLRTKTKSKGGKK